VIKICISSRRRFEDYDIIRDDLIDTGGSAQEIADINKLIADEISFQNNYCG